MIEAPLGRVAPVLDFLSRSWPHAQEQGAELARQVPEPAGFVLFGSGDSHFAARGLELLLRRASGASVTAANAMQAARYLLPGPAEPSPMTVAVGFSVSGEVARTLEGLEVAAAADMHTVAVTADPASRLASSAAALLSLEPGSFDLGPGLAGYLAALLLGAGMACGYAEHDFRTRLDRCMRELPETLSGWLEAEFMAGSEFAAREGGSGAVFLGSGPAYASALYGAAKLVEVSGEYAWGQDVEEWCHLEYFCAEPAMTTVLLSSAGRSASREAELIQAAGAIGRRLLISRWSGGEGWPAGMAELLSAFALWAAPSGYALQRGEMLGEQPFRGFGGGRSQAEGGGASRIRSSRRLQAGELRSLS